MENDMHAISSNERHVPIGQQTRSDGTLYGTDSSDEVELNNVGGLVSFMAVITVIILGGLFILSA